MASNKRTDNFYAERLLSTVKRININSKAIAFAVTSLGSSMMSSIFTFYYVKTFLQRYHVTEPWFQTAQLIYMIWNAVNDPLFGCIQDSAVFRRVVTRRRYVILYGSPLFALSFLVPWFPWADYDSAPTPPAWIAGLQLTVSLCFYDALYSFVLLTQATLFAELSTNHHDRVQLIQYMQVASLVGSTAVFVADSASSGLQHYHLFQMVCVGVAILAGLCYVYTGLKANTEFEKGSEETRTESEASHGTAEETSVSPLMVMRRTKEIFLQRNFICAVLTSFCQCFHMTFLVNFANIFGERLIGETALPSLVKSFYYGSLFILPQILLVFGATFVSKVGYYRIVRASFIVKIFSGIIFLVAGHENGRIAALFLLIECTNVIAVYTVSYLCFPDVIDEDLRRYQRRYPLSSMVNGFSALMAKPAYSLAPMVTVAILNFYGYAAEYDTSIVDFTNSTLANVSVTTIVLSPTTSPATSNMPTTTSDRLTSAMFCMSCLVPICIGVLQLIIWKFYTIRDTHQSDRRQREAVFEETCGEAQLEMQF